MATIEKRGESYRIIVSGGYTAQGKQIRERMTWTPPEGMPADKARKEAERQAVLFEEQIKSGRSVDSRMKLETFIKEKYIPDYVELYLKKSTRSGYKRLCAGIIAALGHMKLCDVRPSHINAFYRNLQEEGMRASQQAVPKIDVAAARKQLGLSKAKLAESCGLTTCVLRASRYICVHMGLTTFASPKVPRMSASAVGVWRMKVPSSAGTSTRLKTTRPFET